MKSNLVKYLIRNLNLKTGTNMNIFGILSNFISEKDNIILEV